MEKHQRKEGDCAKTLPRIQGQWRDAVNKSCQKEVAIEAAVGAEHLRGRGGNEREVSVRTLGGNGGGEGNPGA